MNFEERYLFYEKHHSEERNKVVHIFTVPIIVWTVFVWCAYTPQVWIIPDLGFIIWVIYTFGWALLCIELAVPASAFYGCLWILANIYKQWEPEAWMWAIGIHVICWIGQIASHHYFEGNRPALTESIPEAFAVAPLFVVAEVLFAFGLYGDIQLRIENTKELKQNLTLSVDSTDFTNMTPPPDSTRP